MNENEQTRNDETEAARLWDSERRDSPYSTVADVEDEFCDACGDAHSCETCREADYLERNFGPPISDAEAAYYEERDAEEKRLAALPLVAGRRAVEESGECESCSQTAVLYDQTCYTLGYEGHPGAEQTTFHICAACLTGSR